MRRTLSLALAVGLLAGSFAYQGTTHQGAADKPAEKLFDPQADPAKDLAKAVAQAQKSNKNILLDVGGDWCPWCHKLDKMFKEDKDVAAALKASFIVVKVNFSRENENKKFLKAYPEIPGYPHLFVLDKNGKLLHSQDTGKLETGPAHDHDKVMKFLNAWKPKK